MPRQSLDYVIERNVLFGDLQFSSAILALHNYISRRLSHCGIPRQIYFSLHLSYYRGNIEATNCFTAASAPCSWRTLDSFPSKDLSWTYSALGRFFFPAVILKLRFFFWTAALPSERATQWTQNDKEAKGPASLSQPGSTSAKTGRLKIRQGDSLKVLSTDLLHHKSGHIKVYLLNNGSLNI